MRNRTTVGRDSTHTNNLITRVPTPCQRLQSELPGLIFTPRSNGFVVIGLNGEKYVSDQGLFAKATAVAKQKKLGPTL